MKILLDENFPLGLVRAPESDGLDADHIITLEMRGASDARIRERLSDAKVIFLTQDADFLSGDPAAAVIVVSHVRQSRKLADRIQVWRNAVQELLTMEQLPRLFELTDEGALLPWSVVPYGVGPSSDTGLGLCLYIASEIARAHGGTLEGSSMPPSPDSPSGCRRPSSLPLHRGRPHGYRRPDDRPATG